MATPLVAAIQSGLHNNDKATLAQHAQIIHDGLAAKLSDLQAGAAPVPHRPVVVAVYGVG